MLTTGPGRKAPSKRVITLVLLAPALAYLGFFFAYPLYVTVARSLMAGGGGGFTLDNYATILGSASYWNVIGLTVVLAAGTTVGAVIIAVPLALILRAKGPGHRPLRTLILTPLLALALISALGLLIAWGSHGWLNRGLVALIPFRDEPFSINYTVPGLIMFYTWLYAPFTILTTLSAVQAIDPSVEEAARVSGATPLKLFYKVTLPLAVPGIRAGSILTFLLAFGAFNVPLVAGGNLRPLAVVIYTQAAVFNNWEVGSALATIMAAVAIVIIGLYFGLSGRAIKGGEVT
jgi:ABC-type spermidine/putrescine transport system permease subunit I